MREPDSCTMGACCPARAVAVEFGGDDRLAHDIWWRRYRQAGVGLDDSDPGETGIGATWDRVASALAAVEPDAREHWRAAFRRILEGYRFLPAGRLLAGAGSRRALTLFNCFVMGPIEDSVTGIFRALEEGATTMQQGGGVGYDFSTLHPAGSPLHATGSAASGPVAFLELWDVMCATLTGRGIRPGAMMGTLRCDHPDILAFIDAKRTPGRLGHFNLSVQISDAFMRAVEEDANWELLFPLGPGESAAEVVSRRWSGSAVSVPCALRGRMPARTLWRRLAESAWACGDPGLLFVDRINRENNLGYCERITATNPCGEIPLPPYGACNLGSLNLPAFVLDPFTSSARFDLDALREAATVAVRMLDDAIDASAFPIEAQARCARASRRIGLGITGLADALLLLGLHYGSPRARARAADVMRTIGDAAYRASVALARAKGPFPSFRADAYLDAAFVTRLPEDLREAIARHGIRNSHLLAIAPAGSVSLLAGNVSSGIEPVFAWRQRRRIRNADGTVEERDLEDAAYRLWLRCGGDPSALPESFVTAPDLPAEAHLDMQAALQEHVDNAISKTVNLPARATVEDCAGLLRRAWASGVKGVTLYRPRGADVLSGRTHGVGEPPRGLPRPH